MIKILFKIYAYVFCLFIIPITLFPQVRVHKHLTTEDGLLSNKVMRIIQDSKGYMWFATFKGVSIWDGNSFKNLTKSNGLTSTAILDLVEQPDSSIVISTFGKGLIIYKDGILDTIDTDEGLASNMVSRLRIVNGKTLVFSEKMQEYNSGKILNSINLDVPAQTIIGDLLIDKNGKTYASSRTNGFYVYDGKNEKVYTEKDGLVSDRIDLFEKDKFGNILIATSQGLSKFNNGKISTLKCNGKLVNWTITDIVIGRDSTNYYGSEKGLIIEKNGIVELLTTENGLLENSIWALEEDNLGNIYIGYENNGISIYKPNLFSNFISKNESSEFIANSIMQEDNSKIMLGTNDGITIPSGSKIQRYTEENGLTNNFILSMAKNKDGKIIIGTEKGFNIFNKNIIEPYYRGDKSKQGIYDIEISPYGDILMAVRREGIEIFTLKSQINKTFAKVFNNTLDSAAIQNSKGHGLLFYGNKEKDIEILKDGEIRNINLLNGLRSSWVQDMLFTKDSTLIIGYHGRGISFYKDGKFKHIDKEDGLTDGIINTLFEDSRGRLWVGTAQGGICVFHSNIIDTIDVTDGLSSNDIRGIIHDDNVFYISTENGLNILTENTNGYFIRQIKRSDGLVYNTCNRNALFMDDQKLLWIGTTKGVSKYNPSADRVITAAPKIYLTELEIFNEIYPLEELNSTHELNYDQNYIKFIYTGIDLSAPEKTVYNYRLVGVDKNWVSSKATNVQYTSLSKGKYTFEVKAQNEWGYWSEPTSLSFVINPAWWETWWFRLSFISMLGFLLWLAFQYRLNYLIKLERLRTKIASDLHDEVGSLLTQISVNADSLSYMEDFKKIKEKSGFIRSKSTEVINMMSDVIWSIDSRNDNLESLVDRIHNFAQTFLEQKNISLNFSQNIKNLHKPLKIDFRQNVMLIAKEAINNSVKYSECSQLDININCIDDNFEMIITDNGKGFELEKVKKGNGLKNIKMRAESIGAKIIFKNEKGFTINLIKNKL